MPGRIAFILIHSVQTHARQAQKAQIGRSIICFVVIRDPTGDRTDNVKRTKQTDVDHVLHDHETTKLAVQEQIQAHVAACDDCHVMIAM